MPNYVKEYLVRLGFEPDQTAFRQLDSVMVQAEATVNRHTWGMTGNILKAQVAIVTSFATVSTAILAMADKIAMTDQKYRLMGQRMMMTTESARKLDMISKALGTTLEEASWDPEVHASWLEMAARIDKVTESLGLFSGGKGEANLKAIRGVHNAFAQIGVDLKLLGIGFVSNLFDKLFPKGDATDRIKTWLDWFESSIPRWSNKLATHAAPILKTTWLIFKDLGEVIKTGALAFTNLVGLFSGDNDIQGATFNFDKLAKALQHVADFMKRVEDVFIDAEGAIAHTAAALSMFLHGDLEGASKHMDLAGEALAGGAQKRTAQAKGDAALKEEEGATHWGATALLGYGGLRLGKGLFSKGTTGLAALRGMMGAGTVAEGAEGGSMLGMLGPLGALLGLGGVAANVGHSADWIAHYTLDQLFPGNVGEYNKRKYGAPSAAAAPGVAEGLPGALAAAIAQVESGGNPNALNFRNNNPGNLRSWGDTPMGEGGFAKFSTMEAGEQAMIHQIEKNIGRGLTLREMMSGKKGVYGGWAPKGDKNDPDAYANTLAKWLNIDPDVPLSQLQKSGTEVGRPATSSTKQDVSISLGGIYITRPGAEPHEIQTAVANGVRDGLRGQAQFDMAQVAPAWG
jgi:hypothetical protein